MRMPPRPDQQFGPPKSVAPKPKQQQHTGRGNNASNGQAGKNKGNGQGGGRRSAQGSMASAAQQLVNQEITAGVDSLRQDRRIARRQAKRDRSQANADYQRSLGDLNYIYGETGDYVNNMNSQINQSYTDQAARTAQAQQAFTQQLQGNSQNTAAGLSSELSRLGLQGVDNSQYAADAQNALNVAGQMGVNDQSNIALQQQGANAVGSLLGGMVQGSHLAGVGTAVNAKNDTMFQIFQNKHDAYDQVKEAISDLKATRGDLTLQMIQQLAQSGWGRYLSGGKSHHQSRASGHGYSGGSSGSYGGSSGSSNGATSNTAGGTKSNGNTLAQLLLGALNGSSGPR